jgi:zinc protease
MWNAFTWIDWTAYMETLPGHQAELALRLESDRMVHSRFLPRDVASERTVIIAERQGHENDPSFRLSEEVQAAAFRIHPYHHEVIGDLPDLRSMTRQELLHHYQTYYTPSNAVLAMAGDFSIPQMMRLVRKYFGRLPRRSRPRPVVRPEAEQKGERRVTVEGPGDAAYVEIAYRAPTAAHPDFFPLAVLDSALAGASSFNPFGGGISNKTSRLYRALVEGGWTASVQASLSATIDPFLYTVFLTVRPDRTADQALEAYDREIARLQEQPIDEAEIAKAIQQARALFAYTSESITHQAFWLGYSWMFADYEWFLQYLERIAQVTASEVQRVARTYLDPARRVAGLFRPTGSAA